MKKILLIVLFLFTISLNADQISDLANLNNMAGSLNGAQDNFDSVCPIQTCNDPWQSCIDAGTDQAICDADSLSCNTAGDALCSSLLLSLDSLQSSLDSSVIDYNTNYSDGLNDIYSSDLISDPINQDGGSNYDSSGGGSSGSGSSGSGSSEQGAGGSCGEMEFSALVSCSGTLDFQCSDVNGVATVTVNTCTPPVTPKTCDELVLEYQNSCDSTKYDLSLKCSQDLQGVSTVTDVVCSPKSSPCADRLNEVTANCDLTTSTVTGYNACVDNGMFLIVDPIKCELNEIANAPKESDCTSLSNSTWDGSSCQCDIGYTINQYGICWADISPTATDSEISADITNQQTYAQTLTQSSTSNQANQDILTSNKNLQVTLSGVRQDIAKSNEFLKQIEDNTKDPLLDIQNNILGDYGLKKDSHGNIVKTTEGDSQTITNFINGIKTNITSLKSSFDTAKALISNPFTMTLTNVACTPITITLFGRDVEMDIYSNFQTFRPIITFLLTVMIYILAIKIYIKGLGVHNG